VCKKSPSDANNKQAAWFILGQRKKEPQEYPGGLKS